MSEQKMREKVIRGLKALTSPAFTRDLPCNQQLFRDAIALLEVQEPRVMALEEAVVAEVMFYEPRYCHHGVTKGLDVFPVIRVVDRFSNVVEWYSPYFPEGKVHCLFFPDEYGIFGRCWTSRPTDAQRKATSWPGVQCGGDHV